MLASDRPSVARNAPGFSNAGDIVELVIFTTDKVFLQTLRDAVGDSRRLWHVPSADKISDLVLAGQVGILVLDVQALSGDANQFVGQIKRKFPDLVLLVAGNREAEAGLSSLISAGIIYRFIHKPMSPGRAKLFADAAVKKYAERPKRPPPGRGAARVVDGDGLLLGVIIGAVVVAGIAAAWFTRHGYPENPNPTAVVAAPPAGPPLPARSATTETQERLWARAEDALLEERLDEAAAAIEAARNAGVDSGRIALLSARLAKSRDRARSAATPARPRDEARGRASTPAIVPAGASASAGDERLKQLLSLAEERIKQGRLNDPNDDNARSYVEEAQRIEPHNSAVLAARQSLGIALLAEGRAAIDRHEFARAANLLESADGLATDANVENARHLLSAARQADADTGNQLLQTAQERLRQDRLVDPPADSAKYYLLTLRNANPTHAGLAPALEDLGQRVVANARRELGLKHYAAARTWMDEAAAVGYSAGDANTVSRELEAAVTQQQAAVPQQQAAVTQQQAAVPQQQAAVPQQQAAAIVIPANDLERVKSVAPQYPPRAQLAQTEGWVELDFTVAENGDVKDIEVHAAKPVGVFEQAATRALAQWRFRPVLKDAKPTAQRARIRMRFELPG